MDLMPNQVMRMVQLGMRERLLDSETIWVCASCETCTTRCPNEIDIAKVMESLRQIAIAEGKTDREPAIPQFHEAFLESIRFNGRVFELGMIGRYKLKSRDFLGDMAIGLEMFKRGKLGFFPHRIKKRSEVKELFRKTRTG